MTVLCDSLVDADSDVLADVDPDSE